MGQSTLRGSDKVQPREGQGWAALFLEGNLSSRGQQCQRRAHSPGERQAVPHPSGGVHILGGGGSGGREKSCGRQGSDIPWWLQAAPCQGPLCPAPPHPPPRRGQGPERSFPGPSHGLPQAVIGPKLPSPNSDPDFASFCP